MYALRPVSRDRQRLSGRTALISGGGGGIGRASAERMLSEGAQVMIADVDPRLGNVAGELGCLWHRLDVTDPGSWQRCVAFAERETGGLDLLVNAAGILSTGSIFETSLEDWRRSRAVNLDGVFYGCRAALPALRRRGGGAIVNIASTSGMQGDPRTVAYDATKAGVRGLTKEVAVFCARRGYGIRCNSIHPGAVSTPMLNGLADEDPELHRDWTATLPLGRKAEPAEIAGLVAFLACDESAFVTGAEYKIDGGATA
jgi:NAD(P)-dependent dehydrogenase (short-subunit alcohol dehydrogenase family)